MNQYLITIITLCLQITTLQSHNIDRVYFTTGFKVGQVTDSSAVIWTRLCQQSSPIPISHRQGATHFGAPTDFDENMPVNQMDGAVAGTLGQVQITLYSEKDTLQTDWEYVSAYQDFTIKKQLHRLSPKTTYQVVIKGRKSPNNPITDITGTFTTAPLKSDVAPTLFTVSTCQYFWSFDDRLRGFKIYDSMNKLNPAFHCQTGDYIYYDKPGPMVTNIELARHKWHAMNSRLSLMNFFTKTPIYMEKDDHDLIADDGTPFSPPLGEVSYQDGLMVWQEQVPILGKPYGNYRWGKDLEVWIVEGREYRSKPNKSPDGKDKTMWGNEQIAWFKQTIEASDATFKILISPTPIVGPDRDKGKFDNQSNDSFATEGNWLRKYLVDHNVIVICGDRHWQYVSVDDQTGLWEFSSGAASDLLAGGWQADDVRPEHRFLRVKGGFLATKIYRNKKRPIIEFTHYDVSGNEVHKERIKPNKKGRIYKK